MTDLKWTTDPPAVSGYYWWKCEKECPDNAVMTLFTVPECGLIFSYFIYGDGPSFHSCEKCQYAGPIPLPKR